MRTVLVATEYTVIFADIKIDTIIIIDIIYWFFTSILPYQVIYV
jgi:hypothetical protein